MKMYYLVWKYHAAQADLFEKEYGRGGSWFQLFESDEDYLGHELLKHTEDGTYLVIDKWISKDSYDDFMSSHQSAYNNLSERCKDLYDSEELMGGFDLLAQ